MIRLLRSEVELVGLDSLPAFIAADEPRAWDCKHDRDPRKCRVVRRLFRVQRMERSHHRIHLEARRFDPNEVTALDARRIGGCGCDNK